MTGEASSRHPAGEKLGTGRVVGYAVGDFAFNLFFTFTTLFLLYYYTDVLGLSPTVGGLILMVALVWEGLSDPLIGYIANRTRTRWGRYRPYLLFGTVPLALSFIAMFVPTGLSGSQLAIYALVTHVLFRTVYSVVNIPYIAMSAQLTSDSLERSSLAGGRMIFALLCGLCLAAASLPLVAAFGGGQRGFFGLSLVYAAIGSAILLGSFRATREAPQLSDAPEPGLRQTLRMVAVNRPFQIVLAATALSALSGTVTSKALLYYMKYNVGSPSALTIALTLSTATAAVAVFPWMLVTKRTSKRFVWLCGAGLAATNAFVFYLTAPGLGPLLWAVLVAGGIATSASYLTFWSTIPDTVEFGEWKTGVRAEGALYGLVVLTQKVALGVGVGVLGILLDAIGYRANQTQMPETLEGIHALLTLPPLFAGLGVFALVSAYPLDRRLHSRLSAAVAWRRSRV